MGGWGGGGEGRGGMGRKREQNKENASKCSLRGEGDLAFSLAERFDSVFLMSILDTDRNNGLTNFYTRTFTNGFTIGPSHTRLKSKE